MKSWHVRLMPESEVVNDNYWGYHILAGGAVRYSLGLDSTLPTAVAATLVMVGGRLHANVVT